MGFLLSTGESMYWKWSVVKSLLLSPKVPANPRLHQCSQCNFLPIAYCLLPIGNGLWKASFFLPKFLQSRGSISVHSASTCSHLSRNCSSRTLTRRLGLLFDNHCIIILCNYLPPSVQKLLAKNIVEEANSAKWWSSYHHIWLSSYLFTCLHLFCQEIVRDVRSEHFLED